MVYFAIQRLKACAKISLPSLLSGRFLLRDDIWTGWCFLRPCCATNNLRQFQDLLPLVRVFDG